MVEMKLCTLNKLCVKATEICEKCYIESSNNIKKIYSPAEIIENIQIMIYSEIIATKVLEDENLFDVREFIEFIYSVVDSETGLTKICCECDEKKPRVSNYIKSGYLETLIQLCSSTSSDRSEMFLE